MFHMLSAIGEFERELINERVKEGISKAKSNGVQFGRKPKLTKKQIIQLKVEFKNSPDGMTKEAVAKKYGLSRASAYRVCQEEKQD